MVENGVHEVLHRLLSFLQLLFLLLSLVGLHETIVNQRAFMLIQVQKWTRARLKFLAT